VALTPRQRWEAGTGGPASAAPEPGRRPATAERVPRTALDLPIGERVRSCRQRRGMSQTVLSGLVGRSDRWMVEVEGGECDPRVSDLLRIARALDIDPVDLLSGACSAPSESAAVIRRARAKAMRIERLSTRWGTVVGDVWFPWVVAGYGPYRHEHIESHFHPEEPVYPSEIEEALESLRQDIARREAMGEDVPYDSEDFKLLRFHVSSRTGRLEEPRLVLHFGPTTYYRMLATDQRLDVPLTVGGRTFTLRERYASGVDLRVAPVAELATHWGLGMAVVTADHFVLVSERGNTAVAPHVFFPSVAEGSTRAMDAATDGAPDHVRTAARGMEEELGVLLRPEELTWLSFGANSCLCEYALIGRVDTPFTVDEIDRRRALGAAKDSWETRRLHAVPFTPQAVAEFCAHPERRFSAFALITLVHALMHEFGVTRTDAAFAGVRVAVSQHLPGWVGGAAPPRD
jgi:transcriptional regulator with XRE-family HTH domain